MGNASVKSLVALYAHAGYLRVQRHPTWELAAQTASDAHEDLLRAGHDSHQVARALAQCFGELVGAVLVASATTAQELGEDVTGEELLRYALGALMADEGGTSA
jgi:hypothetical protein